MERPYFVLALCFSVALFPSTTRTSSSQTPSTLTAPGEWTWVSGTTSVNQKSVLGTMGTPSSTSLPAGTFAASSWVDGSGDLWLFGGNGFLTNQMWRFSPATNQWTWMGGDSVAASSAGINDFQSSAGVYGTKGVPSPYNTPGQRIGEVTWTDQSGNFWLFGGFGTIGQQVGYLNDLWEYNKTANEWTWVSGSNQLACAADVPTFCGVVGIYGILGVPAASNAPGGREYASGFIDASGNLWMFGGLGSGGTSPISNANSGALNDLWRFDLSTKQWTWIEGPNTPNQYQSASYGSRGVFAPGNMPGVLSQPATWTDSKGHFWIFGTYNGDTEMWEFDPTLDEWALMSGNLSCSLPCTQLSIFGALGIPAAANMPGPRQSPSTWTDNSGDLWMFGGTGVQPNGIQGSLNELWQFNVASSQWTWMGGTTFLLNGAEQSSVYGTLGSPGSGNVPGIRASSATWTDPQGNLWLFGGNGVGIPDGQSSPSIGALNDLWVYQPSATLPTTATPVISLPTGSYDTTQTVNISDSTHGSIIFYTTDGTEPTTASEIYTGPVNVSSSQTVKAYAIASGCYDSNTTSASFVITNPVNPAPTIGMLSPAFIAAPGAGFTLTISGTGFTTTSTAYWGSAALPTQTLSATQLAAQVPASDLISPGISTITVQNPAPGGGTSGNLQFEVDSPYSGGVPAPAFSPASATIAAGSTANYAVTLPSSATSASAQCLNLPSGAACSYSASSGKLSITTAGSTPVGTYQITVVFTETLPITVGWLLPLFISPLFAVRQKTSRWWVAVLSAAVLSIAAMSAGCGGGAGGAPIPTQTPTHQVTRSGIVTLVVQ